MTHVFIVDDTTFKYHLEYMFAGTGAKDKQSTFLTDPQIQRFPSTTERNLVSMIADISRVRVGDNIVFYLQASNNHEGMFFGVFRCAYTAFFDENNTKNYLKYELGKGLSYRIKIKPFNVFQFGITEHDLLDNISDKTCPYQLCWSLIYRKLKGNRGCTMIMDYEFNDLWNKLMSRNGGKVLQSRSFTYNTSLKAIVGNSIAHQYSGQIQPLNIEPRMMYKAINKSAFETHLQAYIVREITSPNNINCLNMIGINHNLDFWIGNEVSCGVGMQRIDIMIIQEINVNLVNIIPIELKDEKPTEMIFNQIALYVDWIQQYVSPNYMERGKNVTIMPLIIAADTQDINFKNKLKAGGCSYIAFQLNNGNINFKKII